MDHNTMKLILVRPINR